MHKHIIPKNKNKRGHRSPLAEDSLAHTLLHAAGLVQQVIEGANLTDAFETLVTQNVSWSAGKKAAIRDLCWRTLRAYGKGDARIAPFLVKAPPVFVRALLLIAITRLEQRPDEVHTIVNQTVEAAKHGSPDLSALVNGVLRNVLRNEKPVETVWTFPVWWVDQIRETYPSCWKEILASGETHPPMALRCNLRKGSVEEVIAATKTAGIALRHIDGPTLLLEKPVPVSKLPGFSEGRVSIQDVGAQYAARLLAPRAGERILDACAAPGGKTAHILELCDVELLALERDATRAKRIEANLNRLGLQATIRIADCRCLDDWWDGRPFDRILADVPCSASGVTRRHPDIKWLRRKEDIAAFAAQQASILDSLWQTLAPDGTMLYVTCSLFDEENSMQIEHFQKRHPDAATITIDGKPGLQLLPDAEHDGFYFALLKKKG